MDIETRARIFMDETSHSKFSTVFAANLVIKELVDALTQEKILTSQLFERVARYKEALVNIVETESNFAYGIATEVLSTKPL